MKVNGLSTLPGASTAPTVTCFGHMKRIVVYGAVVYGLVAFLAAPFPVELYAGPYADVERTKPPWLILGLYALEDWFGLMALVVAPSAILIGLVLIPYVDRKADLHSTVRKVIVWGYIVVVAVMIMLIIAVGLTPPVQHL